jgi:hypothetical protein
LFVITHREKPILKRSNARKNLITNTTKVVTLTANDKTIQLVPFSKDPKKMVITIEFND